MSRFPRVAVLAALVTSIAVLAGGVLPAQEKLFETRGVLSGDPSLRSQEHGGNTYSVNVKEGTLVEVVAASTEVDTWIDAVLPDGRVLSNDDYDGLNAGFVRMIRETGLLDITVSSLFRHQGGAYTLTVRELPSPRIVSVGDSVSGVLSKRNVRNSRVADLFFVEGQQGEQIVIDLESEDFDAYLEVVNHAGRRAFDDDGGRGFNSRLAYRFDESGFLLITATSALGSGLGSYELRVSPLSRTRVAQYDGRLRRDGRRAYDGRLFEVYEFDGRLGQSLTILLESDDFDPVVYLSHADGRHIASDDDSGGNGNSLIDVALSSTETYRIFVTPFSEGFGRYRLTIFE